MEVEQQEGITLKKGDVVSLSFETNSHRALPSEAKIARVRKDVTWDEVLLNASLRFHNFQNLSGISPSPSLHFFFFCFSSLLQ